MADRARDRREKDRVARLMTLPGAVFVFGSNLAGVHGAGAAKFAAQHYGAKRGVGFGRVGQSFAIPTKADWHDAHGLPLAEIAVGVNGLVGYARHNPLTTFVVPRIGCGFAGWSDREIAPLFRNAPDNCDLPEGWRQLAEASVASPSDLSRAP